MILSIANYNNLLPLTKYCILGAWEMADTIHYPPGGSVNYIDEYGISQTQDMIVSDDITEVFASAVPDTLVGCHFVACPI